MIDKSKQPTAHTTMHSGIGVPDTEDATVNHHTTRPIGRTRDIDIFSMCDMVPFIGKVNATTYSRKSTHPMLWR